MKKLFLGLLVLLLLSAPLFADMSREELQRMYLDYLRSRNIDAHIDSDGDVEFRYTGQYFNALTFWIVVDERDQQFFRIFKPGIYSLDTAAERRQAPLAAAAATYRADVVKIYVQSNGNNVTASAETFVVNPGDFRTVFPKLMRELDRAMNAFVNAME